MPASTPPPLDKNVPGYVEKLTWLESLEAPSDQRSRRLAARAWSGLWPIGLAILIVLAVWQLIHLSGWKKAIFPGPGATLSNLWHQLETGLLWHAIATTAERAVIDNVPLPILTSPPAVPVPLMEPEKLVEVFLAPTVRVAAVTSPR